jgi:hypothetical protein
MASPTLAVAFKDLQADVGFYLGYGRGPDFKQREWDEKKKATIARCVKGGMRKFYFCGHKWSFLKPVAELTLSSGENTLILPDDFGGVESYIVVTQATGICWQPVQYGSIAQVQEQEARLPNSTGRPIICALEPTKTTMHGQNPRSQLHFWPTADQDYTLKAQYYIVPDYLTGEKPYAYGGPDHAETLLEACLAVAEKIGDNTAEVHAAEFATLLNQSKEIDARMKPKNIGYNLDHSDRDTGVRGMMERYQDQRVTFEGVQY